MYSLLERIIEARRKFEKDFGKGPEGIRMSPSFYAGLLNCPDNNSEKTPIILDGSLYGMKIVIDDTMPDGMFMVVSPNLEGC